MKFSCHTIIVDHYPEVNQHLLYNTRTQSMIKIDQELRRTIEEYPKNIKMISKKTWEDLKALHNMGILVENDDEDMLRLKSHMMQLKKSVNAKVLPITILTTYACNFKCSYCFQESSRTFDKMTTETSDHVISWLKYKVKQFGYQKLLINFYGGEPLVNQRTLKEIVSQMKPWCEGEGVEFKFMLQTNGYLMTSQLVDEYIEMGLDQVRISVDGVGEDHDRHRPLRNGKGTFDRVMKNIVDNVDKLKIGISISYDKGQVDHIERFFDYCNDLGITKKLGRFIFSPIHATLGPKEKPEMIQNSSCMCNYEDKSLEDANRKINALMRANGLVSKSGMSTSTCPVTRDNSGMTIDQHGHLYKCNSMLGHPELSTGHVKDLIYNQKHREFVNLDVYKQCPVDCTYMPMCSGGCRLSSFLKNKNFTTPTCHKPYLNKMAPDLIKKDYESLMAKAKPSLAKS